MIIEKVINNNVVTALDKTGSEVVLMGKGIGFQAKSGQDISEECIEKRYVMDSQGDVSRFGKLVESIPLNHLDVSMDIIDYAKQVLNKRLSSSIYISLTDHVNFALERYRSGLLFENPLLNEVRSFYPSEYLVGEYAVELIQKRMNILLPTDEAGSIALHFVNAEYNMTMGATMQVTTILQRFLQILENEVGIVIDHMDLEHAEFVTHLKYLAYRIMRKETIKEYAGELIELMSVMYPKEYLISHQIAEFVRTDYEYELPDDAIASLIIYIRRIRMDAERNERDV